MKGTLIGSGSQCKIDLALATTPDQCRRWKSRLRDGRQMAHFSRTVARDGSFDLRVIIHHEARFDN
jgi:hypothetical protein